MTLGQLIDLTLQWLDDVNAGYYSRSLVTTFINNAQFEVQKLLIGAGENWYTKCVQTTLAVGQADYNLPSDFLKTMRCEIVDSGIYPNETVYRLKMITVNQQDYAWTQSGTVGGFYLKKDKIILVPVPDTSRLLRLYYAYRVAPMVVESEVPDVPEQYHEYLAILAARDGFLKDREQPDWLVQKLNVYEDMLKADAEERRQDEGRDIVTTDGYY